MKTSKSAGRTRASNPVHNAMQACIAQMASSCFFLLLLTRLRSGEPRVRPCSPCGFSACVVGPAAGKQLRDKTSSSSAEPCLLRFVETLGPFALVVEPNPGQKIQCETPASVRYGTRHGVRQNARPSHGGHTSACRRPLLHPEPRCCAMTASPSPSFQYHYWREPFL